MRKKKTHILYVYVKPSNFEAMRKHCRKIKTSHSDYIDKMLEDSFGKKPKDKKGGVHSEAVCSR